MFQEFTGDFSKYKDTSFVNLNNGTLGLSPDVVIDLQKKELGLFEMNTSGAYGAAWDRLWSVQTQLGNFIQARPEDLFLRPNVTLALNELIMGLQLPVASEILTTTFEYGAVVNIVKHKCRRDQLSLRQAPMDFLYSCRDDESAVQGILDCLSPQTRAVVISHIFTGNGLQIPLGLLARQLRQKEILLIVDGAHAPGLIDLDFSSELQDVDFYAGNLHKWFMGPKGTAFAWVHPERQPSLEPQYGSWTTENNIPATMQSFGPYGSFASRFLWSHSLGFSSYYGLEAAFEYWETRKPETLRSQIQMRMQYLKEGLKKAGISSLGAEFDAPLLCYNLSSFPKARFEGLFIAESKVQVGLPRIPGQSVLRLTPHIHNTQSELDIALDVLTRLI